MKVLVTIVMVVTIVDGGSYHGDGGGYHSDNGGYHSDGVGYHSDFVFQVQIYELEEHKIETWRGQRILIPPSY